MSEFSTMIGLEIHVQLKTKTKMFCSCNNNAEGAQPNTLVCPVCLGLPGTLPVANKQAIEWTIKTGLALDCQINKIAKFDRKHYFYPDLPKGYQISQYDQPFCVNGIIEIDGQKVRINRIHLEEDAGKLIHRGDTSLVDLNRAGTPLMEIVTEPDITSSKQAGDFLRNLQKIVRDVVCVSDADMEKGHLRCDANISVNRDGKMSEIVELKNINSFRFIEKALDLEESRLRNEWPNWPEKHGKVTRGYNSAKNETYEQRRKEEAADYRYFPEPDLPLFDTTIFDQESLKAEFKQDEKEKINNLVEMGINENDAKIILSDQVKEEFFQEILSYLTSNSTVWAAKAIVNNYFGFGLTKEDIEKASLYVKIVTAISENIINKNQFSEISFKIKENKINNEEIDKNIAELAGGKLEDTKMLEDIIDKVLTNNPQVVADFKSGKQQAFGFLIGQIMRETQGKANPQVINKILMEKIKL